jgi:hypothetical protein
MLSGFKNVFKFDAFSFTLKIIQMTTLPKFVYLLLLLPILLISCSGNTASDLKKEIEKLKLQCPIDQGEGVVITDVNFFEKEKVVEYTTSIEGVDSIEPELVEEMKRAMVSNISQELALKDKISVTSFLKQGYVFRYIFTNTDNQEMCRLHISEVDF